MKRGRRKTKKDNNPPPALRSSSNSVPENPENPDTNNDPVFQQFDPNSLQGSHQNQNPNIGGSQQNQNMNIGGSSIGGSQQNQNLNIGGSHQNQNSIMRRSHLNPNPNFGSHRNQNLNLGPHQNLNLNMGPHQNQNLNTGPRYPNTRSHQNPNTGLFQYLNQNTSDNPNMGLPGLGLVQYPNQNMNTNTGLNQNWNNNPNVGLPGPSTSSSFPQPNPLSSSIPQNQGGELGITNDIYNYDFNEEPFDLIDLDMNNNTGGNRDNGGYGSTSGTRGESFNPETFPFHEYVPNDNNTDNSGFGIPFKLSHWPAIPQQHVCSCCQVLREIKTYNAKRARNVEVHGRIGMVHHAVLETFDYGHVYGDHYHPENHEYIMHDFCSKSLSDVKQYLIRFLEQTVLDGYTMVYDPMTCYYDAITVGLTLSNAGPNNPFQPFPPDSGDDDSSLGNESQEEESAESEGTNKRRRSGKALAKEGTKGKSFFAAQRERTARMTIDDLKDYLHLPLKTVAKKLNVCASVVKRVCRKGGMTRWPCRKIKALMNKIARKRAELQRTPYPDRAPLLAEIQVLEDELAQILGRPYA